LAKLLGDAVDLDETDSLGPQIDLFQKISGQ
jgi:hypothetical protein